MTLPASGQISLSQVAVELGRASTATTSLGESAVRTLAGVASGAISLSNLWGKSSVITKGFWMGGQYFNSADNILINTIQGVDFPTNTSINPSATLPVAMSGSAGVNSSTKGYLLGGYTLNIATNPDTIIPSSEIQGMDFSTQSAVNPSATLTATIYSAADFSSSSSGYGFGGVTAATPTYYVGAQKFNFSAESCTAISAAPATNRANARGSASSSRGYAHGGHAGATNYTEIDGLQFSNDAAINPSAALATARAFAATGNSSTTAYSVGGTIVGQYGPSFNSEIDGMVFSTETAVNPAAAASGYVYASSTICSSTKSYHAGGYTGTPSNRQAGGSIYSFTFSNESFATESITLAATCERATGVQAYGNAP